MKKDKILVISQYFYPEQFRINDICKEWVKRGHEVTVITGIPNYPQGKFFPGYGLGKKRREVYEGINIRRIPLIPRGNSAVGMVLNYVSFVVSGFFWKCFTRETADRVFIFEVSPMTQALVGVWYAKRRKIPCSIYVQDLWPENVEEVTGIHNSVILGSISKMCDYIYRNCQLILATSPSFVRYLETRESVYDSRGVSKVKYLPQYAEEFYAPARREALKDLTSAECFRVMFTGNIGIAQGLDILPEVAELLKKQGAQCEFVMVGDGRNRRDLEKRIETLGVKGMFLFLGSKESTEIPSYLALADMAFLSFKKSELFSMTIPAKLQSYMACGMPILAVADGETKRIIEEAECGVVCDFDSPEMVAKSIKDCINGNYNLSQMRENAKEYSAKHFDKNEIMDTFERICLDLE